MNERFKSTFKLSHALALIAAVALATVWGAIVQTQYNLGALASIGAQITAEVRLGTTFRDIFSGFSPTYGGYVVLPSLLVAFLIASWIAKRSSASKLMWFGAAGGAAIALGIPIVNWLSPVALLVGATRDVTCTLLMAVGGVFAGLLFAAMTRTHVDDDRSEHPTVVMAS